MEKRNFFIIFFIFCLAYAGFADGEKKFPLNSQQVIGDTAIMVVNNVELPLNNDGSTGEDGQGYYPAGSNLTFLFQGGFASSGYVSGDLRCSWMAKASLIQEWQPGKWGMDPDDPQAKFYTVSLNDGPGSPAYLEWAEAIALGADFIDENGDGVYDPWIDRPALMGTKTIWTVLNDGTSLVQRTPRLGTLQMGLEIQQTVWAYQHGGPLDDVIFFRWKIINADSGDVNDLIHSIWADPDIGNADDDLIACDTLLNIGYIYNDGDDIQYGFNSPAFGMKLLQGALVDSPGDTAYVFRGVFQGVDTLLNKKNLPWTSFMYYINGHQIIGDPSDKNIARNYQIGGLNAAGNPIYPPDWGIGGTSQTNPKYFYSGDPVTASGWIDNTPADKRFLVNNGPFQLALGDTQDIVFAYVIGRGTDALNSITVMRERAAYIDEFFPWGRLLTIAVNHWLLPIDSTFVFDGNVQTLAYPDTIVSANWQLIQRPPGSTAQLMAGPGIQQLLEPDLPGEYTVYLEVLVSSGVTLDTTITVNAVDSRPPNAQLTLIPQQITYGSYIQADAGASSDPDGDPLNFSWSLPGWVSANIQDTSVIEIYPQHIGSGRVEVAVSDPYFTDTASDSFMVTPDVNDLSQQLYSPVFNIMAWMHYIDGNILALEESNTGSRWLQIFEPGNPSAYSSVMVYGSKFTIDNGVFASYGGRSTVQLFVVTPTFDFFFASDTIPYRITNNFTSLDIYLDLPYLYVPNFVTRQLQIYDVSNPYTPIEVASYPIPLLVSEAGYEGDIAVVSSRLSNFGLVTYDLSDVMNVIPLDTLPLSSNGYRYIEMGGGKIYAATYSGGATEVQIVDASQPDNLQLAGSITLNSGSILEMKAYGDLLILGLSKGIRLYDVSDPNSPVEIAHRYSGFPVRGAAWNDPALYLVENGDPQFGAGYYYFDYIVGIGDDSKLPEVPAGFRLLQNYPNPFNPETTIGYQLPVAAKVELAIYNILGQKIRSLISERQTAGSYEVQWDGKNNAGISVASGIYFYKLYADTPSSSSPQGSFEKSFVHIRKMLLIK